jgi:hypothetical protein
MPRLIAHIILISRVRTLEVIIKPSLDFNHAMLAPGQPPLNERSDGRPGSKNGKIKKQTRDNN